MRPSPDLILVQAATPGPGAEWTYTLPAALGQLVITMVHALLTTSAGSAAVRDPNLVISDPSGNTKARACSAAGLTGSLISGVTKRFVWGQTGAAYTSSDALTEHLPLQQAYCRGDDVVRVETTDLQATDQWSEVFIWFERFQP